MTPKLAGTLALSLFLFSDFSFHFKSQREQVRDATCALFIIHNDFIYRLFKGQEAVSTCTASLIRANDSGYVALSAGHCVSKDATYAVSFTGSRHDAVPAVFLKKFDGNGADFSLFAVQTKERHVVLELGDETKLRAGDEVITYENMGNYGLQYEAGHVSQLGTTRKLDSDIWGTTGMLLVWLPGAPGASGSPVVSTTQHALIGILVGAVEDDANSVVVPIGALKRSLAGH